MNAMNKKRGLAGMVAVLFLGLAVLLLSACSDEMEVQQSYPFKDVYKRQLYDGRAFRKEPDDSDILVCKECGSRQLEIQAWINANTDERISYVHDDNNGLWCDGKWCEECGVQVFFCTKAEFTQKMQGWWESCGFETKEQITGLKVCDSPPSENTQTFIDAADQWWNSRDYEHKREIYNRYNSKNE